MHHARLSRSVLAALLICALGLAALFFASNGAQAQAQGDTPAIESFEGARIGNGNYFIGWSFTVDEETSVADLGAFDANGNGQLDNDGATSVGLYQGTTELALVEVPAGAAVVDGFAYAPVPSPVTLQPGVTYTVAAETQSAGEPIALQGQLVTADGVNFVSSAFAFGSSPQAPYGANSVVGYIGGSFRIASSSVPPVATVAPTLAPTLPPVGPAPQSSIPGPIEAEDYDQFSDTDADNRGTAAQYTAGVDVWNTIGEDGFTVGRIRPDEFTTYEITAQNAAKYRFSIRTASANAAGGAVTLWIDDVAYGVVQVPASGSWWQFQDSVIGDIDVAAGPHTVKVEWGAGQVNFDRLDVSIAPTNAGPVISSIPGPIEAEDYDDFSDTDADNRGSADQYTDGVDVWNTIGEDGFTVGRLRPNEFTTYEVNVTEDGSYAFSIRAAGANAAGQQVALSIDGSEFASAVVPASGSWWEFETTQLGSTILTAGRHTLTVEWGAGQVNFDRLDVSPASAVNTPTAVPAQPTPTIDVPASPGACAGLSQEAENGSVSGNMILRGDSSASGGAYVVAPNGGSQRNGDDYVAFCVVPPASSVYRMDAEVSAPNSAGDSFFVTLDEGPRVIWDIPIVAAWNVDSVNHRTSGDDPVTFELEAGTEHEVRVWQREDGARIDSFTFIEVGGQANYGVAASTPTAVPNTPTAVPNTPTPVPNTPTPPQSTPTPAPSGQVIDVPGPVEAEAYNSVFLDTDAGNLGSASAQYTDDVDVFATSGEAGFTVGRIRPTEFTNYNLNVTETETYNVTIRAASGDATGGRVRIEIDGTVVGAINVGNTGGWWNFDTFSVGQIQLDAGAHNLKAAWPTGNVNFDRLDIYVDGRPLPTPTPAPPTSTPIPTATSIPTPTPTPLPAATCRGLDRVHEFEQAPYGGAFEPRNGEGSRSGGYIVVPNGSGGSNLEPSPFSYVNLCVTAPVDGRYTFEVRTRPASSNDDSIWFQIDDEAPVNAGIPQTPDWKFQRMSGVEVYDLTAGDHQIRISLREDGTELDAFQMVLLDAVCSNSASAEAEDGGLNGIYVAVNDGSASNGKYAVNGQARNGTYPSADYVEFCLTAPADGRYRIDARTRADGNSNSFYVDVDGGNDVEWGASSDPGWVDGSVRPLGQNRPANWELTAGDHVVRFYLRETGTQLDKVSLVRTDLVQVSPGDDLGQMVLDGSPGDTFIFSDGIYNVSKIRPQDGMTFRAENPRVGAAGNAIFDGQGVNSLLFSGLAEGVTIEGFEIREYDPGIFQSPISARFTAEGPEQFDDGLNWVVRNNYIHSNYAAGINVGSGMLIEGNLISRNSHIGISGLAQSGDELYDIKIRDNVINGNTMANPDFDYAFHEGGIKLAHAIRTEITGNNIYNNRGAGVYCDVLCEDILVDDNDINRNGGRRNAGGVMLEIVDGATITNNRINGVADYTTDNPFWGGIVAAEVQNALIEDNEIIMNGATGLIFRNRSDIPTREEPPQFIRSDLANVRFINNTITAVDGETRVGYSRGPVDINPGAVVMSGNTYIEAGPGPDGPGGTFRFTYDGAETWADWQNVLGFDVDGSYQPQ